MIRLILMGPPGAGKGTQAARIAQRYDIPAISTGDIFRANVSEGTALGVKAQTYMDAGDYVPDEVTNDMVRDRLDKDDARRGFLLDGYPRTVAQVAELDSMLADAGAAVDRVVVLIADEEILVARLTERAVKEGRSDDTEDVIRRRQQVYREQTEPLIDLYQQRNLLVHVDGVGEVDEVTERLVVAIEAKIG